MSVLDNMVAHFSEQEMKEIEVPEWGDEQGSLIIYTKPFTLKEQKRLTTLAKNDAIEMLAHTLIMKALNANGEKLFNLGDKTKLMNNVDPFILARVVAEITATDSIEDHLGN